VKYVINEKYAVFKHKNGMLRLYLEKFTVNKMLSKSGPEFLYYGVY